MVLRVAIIGSGAAGLVSLQLMLAKPAIYQPVVFEQSPHVGGTWKYSELVDKDMHGLPIHSSMYFNLKTNLPKEIMQFPGFPFPKDTNSFATHIDVQQYLESYTSHYKLLSNIKLNHLVENVSPYETTEGLQWKITVKSLIDSSLNVKSFDAVVICNGHYSVPLIPQLPGLSNFTGRIIHSHAYRHPEDFEALKVVILGARSSGQDISLDLADHAKLIYLSHRGENMTCPLPSNVHQVPGISHVDANSVHLRNGTQLQIDCIMFCTGYKYEFPFLSKECMPRIEDERVYPLYKHVIHTDYPTLSFIGIPKVVVPFPLFYCQAHFVLAHLEKKMILPSRKDMLKDIDDDFQSRLLKGMPVRYAHHLSKQQWDYNDELLKLANIEPLPTYLSYLHDVVHDNRKEDLINYKRGNFVKDKNDKFIFVKTS